MFKYRGLITAVLFVALLLLPPSFEAIGIPIFIAAALLRIWARMHIGQHSRGGELACPEIAQAGPYKFTKHPLYLSNFMAGFGLALLHAGFSMGTLAFTATYAIFLTYLAHKENEFLLGKARLAPASQQSILKSILSDRITWLWQITMLAMIFLLYYL